MGNHKIHHIPVWYTLLSAMADARRGNISQSMEYADARRRANDRRYERSPSHVLLHVQPRLHARSTLRHAEYTGSMTGTVSVCAYGSHSPQVWIDLPDRSEQTTHKCEVILSY